MKGAVQTLLLELVGEMQSYGGLTYNIRTTHPYPTKSAVVGMLAAALGRPRGSYVGDLASLRMAVRIDRPGILEEDFVSIRRVVTSDLKSRKTRTMTKQYLADAAFLVGLEGEPSIVGMAHSALMCPVYQVYLGRKAYFPSRPVTRPGYLLSVPLERAVAQHPPLVPHVPASKTTLIEHPEGAFVAHDQPLDSLDRNYTVRTHRVKKG